MLILKRYRQVPKTTHKYKSENIPIKSNLNYEKMRLISVSEKLNFFINSRFSVLMQCPVSFVRRGALDDPSYSSNMLCNKGE